MSIKTTNEKEVFALETDSGIIAIALMIYRKFCEEQGSPQSLIDRISELENNFRNKE